MSKTMKCDRCGQDIPCNNRMQINGYSARIDIHRPKMSRNCPPDKIDVCLICYEKFINWLESEAGE